MKNITIYLLVAFLPLGLFGQYQITGEVVLPSGLPICEVLVELQDASGEVLAQDISEMDGTFELSDVPEGTNYTLLFTKEGAAIGGTSTFDLVLISRYILGINPAPPYYNWIADVNGSGTVTTLDMLIIRKVILHIDPAFPVPTWAFDEPTAQSPDNQIGLPTVNADLDLQVVGVKRGDINGTIQVDCN